MTFNTDKSVEIKGVSMCAKCNSDQVLGMPAMNELATSAFGLDGGQEVRAILRIAPMAGTAAATTPETRKRCILLVDDDRLALAAISKGLQRAGYETIQTHSGQDALRLAAESKPDLVVLDISLAEMSGIELARLLREQAPIPFMLLSSSGESGSVRQAMENGAVAYLVKPLSVTQIIPAIEVGLARGAEIGSLRLAQSVLTNALADGRETNTAIGVLMERYHVNRQQAFEILRSHARAQRRKINCVAADVLNAKNMLDLFPPQSKKNLPDKRRMLRNLAGHPAQPGADVKVPAQ